MFRFDYGNPSTTSILRTIKANPDAKDYTYVICGKSGPTGKTTLRKDLVNLGYNAIEISEILDDSVVYCNSGNDVQVDECNKCILIVLNQPIKL